MAGKHVENDDTKANVAAGDHSHHAALHNDAYTPPLNHRVLNVDGTIKPGKCAPGPELNSLTIDVAHVHRHDEPKRGDSYADRQAALKREMPVSDEHFRELVKKGTEYAAINDGNFNIQMRHALDEANQSDKSMKTGHKHVDDVLKYANANLCGTDYTLRREGNIVSVYDAHSSSTKPSGRWNLDKNAWEK